MKPKDIKSIDIDGREWRDKTYGNSYFSARVVVNYGLPMEKVFYVPFQYGYGDSYIDASLGIIGDAYGIPRRNLATWFLRDEYGIFVRASKIPAKKQTAKAWGTDPEMSSKKLISKGRGGFLLAEGEEVISHNRRRGIRRKGSKIPLSTARAMVRAGLPLSRSDLRGNAKYKNLSYMPINMTTKGIYTDLMNLKRLKNNDEMIEDVRVMPRKGHPNDYIVGVKHRYYVDGRRVYSAGQKTEGRIAKWGRIIGYKQKRVGNSDYVFNYYGIRVQRDDYAKKGSLFDNSSMSERYMKRSKRYLVTKKFTAGPMKGMTIVDESPVPFYVGFKPSKPYFGSPYIVTKTQVNL